MSTTQVTRNKDYLRNLIIILMCLFLLCQTNSLSLSLSIDRHSGTKGAILKVFQETWVINNDGQLSLYFSLFFYSVSFNVFPFVSIDVRKI